ncbi:hypothetical protein CMV_013580 [Castanea mollissima]|uniref:FBD domain-containing protein n=1 Tax=Castanea mollissima TaxID=60419 RepID=A0A8J4VVF9_9ROSI|nr:hypothetical protein CMV_013580 [Castanea mollissima]
MREDGVASKVQTESTTEQENLRHKLRKIQKLSARKRRKEWLFQGNNQTMDQGSLIKDSKTQMCYNLRLPYSIFFPSFKILTLKHIIFPDDQSTQRLFSGCPVLEELTLDDCYWDNINAISISAPMLKSLVIYDLLDSESRHQIEVAYHANKLIKELSNVESLVLTPQTVEALDYKEEFIAHLPKFHNLAHLEFYTGFVDMASGALMKVFQNSPCLASLELNGGIELTKEDWKLDHVPPCFLTHLKTIKIGDFLGTEEEVLVVRTLLQNTAVLERMVISWSKEFSGQGQKQKAYHHDQKKRMHEFWNSP